MGRRLKYRKLDENGLLILERGNGWYIALDEETGKKRRIDTKRRKRKGGHNTKNILNHPKAGSGGFHKNPQNIYTGNVGNKIVNDRKAKREAGVLWKENQNECLRVMLNMKRSELLAYMVQWGMDTPDQIVFQYRYDVTEKDLKGLDKSEPTMIQITSLRMVLAAYENAKFALNLLELLEGKAVSQDVLAKKADKKEASKKLKEEHKDDFNQVLDAIKNKVLGSEDLNVEEQPESAASIAVTKQNEASEFENLLEELASGDGEE